MMRRLVPETPSRMGKGTEVTGFETRPQETEVELIRTAKCARRMVTGEEIREIHRLVKL